MGRRLKHKKMEIGQNLATMRKRKQQIMEETLTLSRSKKRCSSSGEGYFDLIPVDLIIKIMSKLSGKSMALVVDNSSSKLQPVVPDQVSGSTEVPFRRRSWRKVVLVLNTSASRTS